MPSALEAWIMIVAALAAPPLIVALARSFETPTERYARLRRRADRRLLTGLPTRSLDRGQR